MEQPQVRVRVNVSRTSKGAPAFECTVESVLPIDVSDEDGLSLMQAFSNDVLQESARVEAILQEKYGAEWTNGA